MAILNPIYYMSNRAGIPRIQSTGVTVNGTTEVRYSFSADASFSMNYSGLVLVKIAQAVPAAATETMNIVFTSAAGDQAVTGYGGEPLTVGAFGDAGIYLCYFDRASNTLQALTGVAIG